MRLLVIWLDHLTGVSDTAQCDVAHRWMSESIRFLVSVRTYSRLLGTVLPQRCLQMEAVDRGDSQAL